MIELLGIGIADPEGRPLLRQLCVRLETAEVVLVLSSEKEERLAVLDVITGRRFPDEGRVWMSRLPVMRETTRQVRSLVAELPPHERFVEDPLALRAYVTREEAKSAAGWPGLAGVWRWRRADYLIVREIDTAWRLGQARLLLGRLRAVAVSERVIVVASAGSPSVAAYADRVLLLDAGAVRFDGSSVEFDQRLAS